MKSFGIYQKDYDTEMQKIIADSDEGWYRDELLSNLESRYSNLVFRDEQVSRKFNFTIKESIVRNGASKIFENWAAHSTITQDDFIEALRWVCEDPKNGGNWIRLTREIALTPSGIKKLDRCYYDNGDFSGFFEHETGKRWDGEFFEQPCDKKWSDTGFIKLIQKISLSAEDRV